MNQLFTKQQLARNVIRVVCQALDGARRVPPVFTSAGFHFADDCYVVLEDATRLFCEAISADHGERAGSRWSAILPKLLFDQPEKCAEILAVIEREDYQRCPAPEPLMV